VKEIIYYDYLDVALIRHMRRCRKYCAKNFTQNYVEGPACFHLWCTIVQRIECAPVQNETTKLRILIQTKLGNAVFSPSKCSLFTRKGVNFAVLLHPLEGVLKGVLGFVAKIALTR
jgi:hypothetical protein